MEYNLNKLKLFETKTINLDKIILNQGKVTNGRTNHNRKINKVAVMRKTGRRLMKTRKKTNKRKWWKRNKVKNLRLKNT